jgi:hypothetical protein
MSLPDAIIWVNHRVTEIGILVVWRPDFRDFWPPADPKIRLSGTPRKPRKCKKSGIFRPEPQNPLQSGGGGGRKLGGAGGRKKPRCGVWGLNLLPDFLVTALKGTRADVVQGKLRGLEGP